MVESSISGAVAPGAEAVIRLSSFAGVLLLMAWGEATAPRRALTQSKPGRWFSNLAVVGINTGLVRLLLPMVPVALAVIASQQQWGLLNNVALPVPLEVVLGVVLLDCAIYIQHVLFHALPLLWRLHRMHHADMDIDVTTGLRFHPVEILLSIGDQAGGGCGPGSPSARGPDLRGASERHLHVQPRQPANSIGPRPVAALAGGHP